MKRHACSNWCASKGGPALFRRRPLLRGPHPDEVLQLFRTTQARGVRGNHEETLLKWHRAHHEPARGEARLGRSHQSSRIGSRVKIGHCSNRSICGSISPTIGSGSSMPE